MRAPCWAGRYFASVLAAAASFASAAALPLGPMHWGAPSAGHAMLEQPAGDDGPLRVRIARATEPFYDIVAARTVAAPVAAGDRLRLSFRGRSPTGNPLRAVVEQSGAPWTAVASTLPTLGPAWREYRATGTALQAYATNGLTFRLQMGQRTGEVELADLRVEDLGVDPARVAARAALAPAAIAARIERCRKTDLAVAVTEADGRPAAGARVTVRQRRHAFLFGANIFNLEPDNHAAWQQDYQARFLALLNYATLPFYWGDFEREPGQPNYARLDAMSRWCAAHGLAMKGHPLVWHEAYPRWAPKTADAAVPLLRQRVFDIIGRYRDTITRWDVVNEANAAAGCSPPNGESAWMVRDGAAAAAVATALGWAREASRGAKGPVTLIYNDFETGEANEALLAGLAARQALPDAIGIQSHMHHGTWPLEDVWLRAETFARFGRPIHFTEVTVVSGPKRDVDYSHDVPDWRTTPEDERAQADYVEAFYRLLFSHPAVQAITWWDFSDRGAWLQAPAGFVRADMSPKPVYERLMKLVKHDWWTNVAGPADARGRFATRAFYGEHEVTAESADGRRATAIVDLPMGGGSSRVTLQLPAR